MLSTEFTFKQVPKKMLSQIIHYSQKVTNHFVF